MAATMAQKQCTTRVFRSRALPVPGLHSARLRCQALETAQEVQQVQLPVGQVHPFQATEFDELLSACSATSRLLVVDVYTQWCGPCKMIAPELEQMAAEYGAKALISKIDCTTNPDNKKWAMAQNVKALPTFILFKEGKRVNDMTGAKASTLRKLIEAHF